MDLPSGTHLGAYEILSPLGVGGMGEVYCARDARLGRDVAIKILPRAFTSDSHRLARFEREARVLATLSHPNIAAIYGVEESGDVRALVLELVEGETLAERIVRGGGGVRSNGSFERAMPPHDALAIARQIAEALDIAHEKGIVHRDLKPANIMITSDGVVKVLDFGLAKQAIEQTAPYSPTVTLHHTREGDVVGTAAYMSPEQARGQSVDKRTDIWAFGCVLYEMLTGRPAFAGPTFSDTVAAVLDTEPAWAALPATVPPAIRRLLERTLEKDPKRRLRDIGDAKAEIDGTQRGPEPREPVASGTVRTHWHYAWFATAALVALGVAAAVWMRQPTPRVLPETRLEISTPPTTTSRQALAISPDGLTVAFVGNSDGRSVLWLRPLSGAARPVDGTVGATLPFWSPDSQSLGFFADGKLKRIEVKGGAAQVLADALDPQGGSWSRDGSIIFTPHQISPLVRVAAAGGAPVAVTRLAAGHTGHLFPQVLSDGAHVVYYAEGVPDVQGVYVSRLDGTSPKRLLAKSSPIVYLATGYLLYVREGVLLAQALDPVRLELKGDAVAIADRVAVSGGNRPAASASNNGDIVYRGVPTGSARQLTWLDRSGKTVRLVGSPDSARRGTVVSLSPNGRRVAVIRRLGDTSDLWLLDLDRNGVMSRLTFGGKESSPLWSRDGLHVAYTSNRNGVMDLYEASVDGGHDEPLLVTPEKKVAAGWSPNGRVLLYANADSNQDVDRNTHLDIWALPIGSGEKPFPLVRSPYEDINPQFGPDGTWLVYQSTVSSRYEVYVRPFTDPGPPVPISTEGATQPRLRRDGKELFYVTLDHWMMAVPIAVSAHARSVEAGTPVRLFKTTIGGPESGYSQREYEVSPDGQQFLFDLLIEQPSPPIILIQNWRP